MSLDAFQGAFFCAYLEPIFLYLPLPLTWPFIGFIGAFRALGHGLPWTAAMNAKNTFSQSSVRQHIFLTGWRVCQTFAHPVLFSVCHSMMF